MQKNPCNSSLAGPLKVRGSNTQSAFKTFLVVLIGLCSHVYPGIYVCPSVCVYVFMLYHIPVQLQMVGHFTVYALEGRGGEVRWHHTPRDFQVTSAYPTVSAA